MVPEFSFEESGFLLLLLLCFVWGMPKLPWPGVEPLSQGLSHSSDQVPSPTPGATRGFPQCSLLHTTLREPTQCLKQYVLSCATFEGAWGPISVHS